MSARANLSMGFESETFERDGEPLYLLSGEFPYYRMDSSLWEDRLQKVWEMGIRGLSFYVPWAFHSGGPDEIDLSGENGVSRRNVKGFASLAASMGFGLIVKPGPFICAEYRRGGIPDWVMRLHPEVALKDCAGRDVGFFQDGLPLPDLLHPTFLEHLRVWYNAVANQLLLPLQAEGSLSAVQVENEYPYSSLDFTNPFSFGYSAHHVEGFRRFARTKGLPDLDPPRRMMLEDPKDWLRFRAWLEYKEDMGQRVIREYAQILRESGVTVPLYHDLVMIENEPPTHFGKMAEVLPVCPNYWLEAHPAYDTASYARALVRTKLVKSVQPGRVLYSSESNWSWGSEEEFTFLMTLLAPHLVGLNVYCAVDGAHSGLIDGNPASNLPDPYPGCAPIAADGSTRPAYDSLKHFYGFLQEDSGRCGAELAGAQERADIALVNYTQYNYPRVIMDATYNTSEELRKLLPETPCMNGWLRGIAEAFIERSLPFDIVDLERGSVETFRRYRLLCAPGYRLMDRRTQEKLIEYVREGGLLFISPELPDHDMDLRADSRLRDELLPGFEFERVFVYHNVEWQGFGCLGADLSPLRIVSNYDDARLSGFPAHRVVARLWSGSPVAIKVEYGRGTLYWLGVDLSRLPRRSEFLDWICQTHGVNRPVRIEAKSPGASPAEVHVTVTTHGGDGGFVIATNRSNHDFRGTVSIDSDKPNRMHLEMDVQLPARRSLFVRVEKGRPKAVHSTVPGESARVELVCPTGPSQADRKE